VDHLRNESLCAPNSDESFNLRYWFDASNYKPGGLVLVLKPSETSGVGGLPFLEKGIVAQLTQATHRIGVIFEHRYYCTFLPTPDIFTENLRFLTNEQGGLADQVYLLLVQKVPEAFLSLCKKDET
jgi:hypothetical protein